MHSSFPNRRLRRLRSTSSLRSLVREVYLNADKLIAPIFVKHGSKLKQPIASMPGYFQWSIDCLNEEIDSIRALGLKSVLLFGIPEKKDALGSSSYSDEGIIQTAIRTIREYAPELLIIADVCLCEYTDHGHCGKINSSKENAEVCIENDESLELLAKQAVSYAKAGADVLAPSACMDGMVQAIRCALDQSYYSDRSILSYAVKYASSLYGPFRQAAEGAPKFGDRRSYQMDYTNRRGAILECNLDVQEGADMLMVKPAHTYLDIIRDVKTQFPELPLGAYHTSGEFAMIKAAAQNAWVDEEKAVIEILSAIHRAGADFIITYYAKDAARWLSHY